jgi:hypothetical protein
MGLVRKPSKSQGRRRRARGRIERVPSFPFDVDLLRLALFPFFRFQVYRHARSRWITPPSRSPMLSLVSHYLPTLPVGESGASADPPLISSRSCCSLHRFEAHSSHHLASSKSDRSILFPDQSACRARLAIQPILDFFSLLFLRRRLGTLAFSSPPSLAANISHLPPEILALIRDQVFLMSRTLHRRTLANDVGPCPCRPESCERVCGVTRAFKSCNSKRCSGRRGCDYGLGNSCPERSEELAQRLLEKFKADAVDGPVRPYSSSTDSALVAP